MNQDKNKPSLKTFFIKLAAITLSIIIIINVTYNLIFADKLEAINKISSLNNKENIEQIKNKIREELKQGLKKERILNNEDAELINKFYSKIKKELKSN
tara:strand:+ start:1463 stop:1759 length:297 start_codon:yes stop_codon:yes gene_type:complete